ncbi:hypothetical protein pipiens_002191 [Culex pipiens pipiens]|uniref:Uncharacterized protein n=1 Tax=Culex pipiens pipiens TaxID=38569 RepID=A0ABD1DIN1_CULPP
MSVCNTSPIVSEIKTNPVKRGRSDDDSDDGTPKPVTLEDLMDAMTKQFKLTQEHIDAVNTTITEKIESVKAELDDKLDAVSRDIASFKDECAARFTVNEGALQTLNEQVDGISQEIGGLEKRNELIAMWKHVGLEETQIPPVDVRRLNTSNSSEKNGLIMLQFALRNHRDDFYSGYLQKCSLQLSHLGIDSTRRVFVSENLTFAARQIKRAALRLKEAGKLSSVFTKLGIVFVKRRKDQQAVAISTESQLSSFL